MTTPQAPEPFLTVDEFAAEYGTLTSYQRNQATDLLLAATIWIQARVPVTSIYYNNAKLVCYEVTAAAIRLAPVTGLTQFSATTGHKTESGSLADPLAVLEFTDRHRELLGLPLVAEPSAVVASGWDDPNVDPVW